MPAGDDKKDIQSGFLTERGDAAFDLVNAFWSTVWALFARTALDLDPSIVPSFPQV